MLKDSLQAQQRIETNSFHIAQAFACLDPKLTQQLSTCWLQGHWGLALWERLLENPGGHMTKPPPGEKGTGKISKKFGAFLAVSLALFSCSLGKGEF